MKTQIAKIRKSLIDSAKKKRERTAHFKSGGTVANLPSHLKFKNSARPFKLEESRDWFI